jgi:ribose 5-phosphate isomerase A
MTPKQRAAQAALAHVRSGMLLGLGTGSTADCFIRALAEALGRGALNDIRCVPTSIQSQKLAEQLGVPLTTLSEVGTLDLTVDGADEIDPNLDLIKGLGGALLREKIVAQNSRALLIVADSSKRVARLGQRCPLPVEVVPFEHACQAAFLAGLGCRPTLRLGPDATPFITDNGNVIYDCRFDGIASPRRLLDELAHRAGIVECGLFLGMATKAVVADEREVVEMVA